MFSSIKQRMPSAMLVIATACAFSLHLPCTAQQQLPQQPQPAQALPPAIGTPVQKARPMPESNIKIDPNEVRNNVLNQINTKAGGAYKVTAQPPTGFLIPTYPGAINPTFTYSRAYASGTLVTKDPLNGVANFYKAQVSQGSWNITPHNTSTAEASGRAFIITATKDDNVANQTLNLTVSGIKPPVGDSAIINVTITKFPKLPPK